MLEETLAFLMSSGDQRLLIMVKPNHPWGVVAHKLLHKVSSELPGRDVISDFVSEVEDM